MAALLNPLRFVSFVEEVKPREVKIAEIAYFMAERRGFEPGHETADWAAAEIEYDNRPRP